MSENIRKIVNSVFEINNFINKNGYDYSVDSIYDIYKDYYKKNAHISYTSKHCIENLKHHLEVLYENFYDEE